ncbi:hypothetical protein OG875_10160 [Streptomyces sp. NBC_01498]|uniref:hypothetical protein n=1 Tax=Streptomyces sp. NBC_01498 TaxID=2975870 RepID=UPI002E7B17FA|nr:hypothetical protein [Streptomyces sp. NBC_01498]WTL24930.1 hypothetical protein OG875_10160 [Streptomyces sp. NBC_01498]
MPDMDATQAVTQLVPLAKELDENKVTPGVLGFVVFAVMAGAVWLLMKSMNRHMGKVDFDEESTETETGPTAKETARTPDTARASAAPAGDGRTTRGA